MTDVRTINNQTGLDELTSSNRYVLVDFCAQWCGPCQTIAPVFQNLADRHGIDGRLAFAKVDVDEVPEVAQRFGIKAMPTFMILVDGNPVGPEEDIGVRAMLKGADPAALMGMAQSLEGLSRKGGDGASSGGEDEEEG